MRGERENGGIIMMRLGAGRLAKIALRCSAITRLWDVESGSELAVLRRHEYEV